tara:strand:- start:616 stop:1389 length:774 start_codon:yes stop_codon:yes gene_type:complete
MKKILITGKSGYIAKELYKHLKGKYEVTTIGREDFSLEDTEATDEFFSNKLYDVVIHTAIIGGNRLYKDSVKCFNSNVDIFLNILKNKNKFKRLINFGSGAQFSLNPKFYGLSKRMINEIIKYVDDAYELRIYGIFNENELDSRFIKSAIKSNLQKQNITIFENKFMDYIYMEDFCSLVEYYIEANKPQKEMDCCYEDKITLFNIAETINKISGFESNINIESHTYYDYIGSKNKLPIKTIGLVEGIRKTFSILKNE